MDVRLPDIDGTAAARSLKADARTARIPVVAVTSFAMTGERERFLVEGFDGYLEKADQRPGVRRPGGRLLCGGRGAVSADVRPKVLVVDDATRNVRLIEAILTADGYAVSSASSGPKALAMVAAEVPDIVPLDVLMPGMNGYEVCRRLREQEATRFLPVVMVTASDSEVRVTAIEAGADDFITKPFNHQELLARLRSLVRIKRFHDTIQAQAAELADWNRTLEARVGEQVAELERMNRLHRFLSPALAEY